MNEDHNEKLAEERTDWAEDRTALATERTFAGWIRTGLASVGVGLATHAIFNADGTHNTPRIVATFFIAIGIFIFWSAYRNSAATLARLHWHTAEPVSRRNLALTAFLISIASAFLGVVLWLV